MELIQAFEEEFYPRLGASKRWQAILEISRALLGMAREVNILETGSLRIPGNWEGDGQSTVVWGWIAARTGGKLTSVDISQDSIRTASSAVPEANFINSDSITALRGLAGVGLFDLVYLDSYDVTGKYDSPLHHMGELAAIYDKLKSGCLVAVDDCDFKHGKDRYIRMFMSDIGAKQICSGYINCWEKA